MGRPRMRNLDLAFVHGLVAMALEMSGIHHPSDVAPSSLFQVASVLNQAGFSVEVVCGEKDGLQLRWIELGLSEGDLDVIVDISNQLGPGEGVFRKGSRRGEEFLRRFASAMPMKSGSARL